VIQSKDAGLPSGIRPKVLVYPQDPNIIWVGYAGYQAGIKVFWSINDGASWSNISGSLPNVPINCMAADNNANLYVGTDVGVFVRNAFSNDWTPFSNGLPRVPVTSIVVNNTAGLIRISTLGRGVYSTALAGGSTFCPPTDVVSASLHGQHFFQAGGSINTSSVLTGSAGTDVTMRAGSFVTMSPGFVANAGSFFVATNGPCYTGVPAYVAPGPLSQPAEQLLDAPGGSGAGIPLSPSVPPLPAESSPAPFILNSIPPARQPAVKPVVKPKSVKVGRSGVRP
jgi:hypothetical protein